MKKCGIYACPNRCSRMYQMSPVDNIWLCDECIDEMEDLVQQEIQAITGAKEEVLAALAS